MNCLHYGSDENEEVRLEMGGVNLEKDDPAKQFLEVEKTIVHENYTETPEALYNDIGQWFIFISCRLLICVIK